MGSKCSYFRVKGWEKGKFDKIVPILAVHRNFVIMMVKSTDLVVQPNG